MKSDESLGFEAERPEKEETLDDLLFSEGEESLDDLLFAEEKPGRLERQLGFAAQIPVPFVGRVGDLSETARGWYNNASSKPWQTPEEAAADQDPDAAVRRRMTAPEAAVQSLFQGAAGLARLPFAVGQSAGADKVMQRARAGDFSGMPAAQASFILEREFPEYVPPEDEGDEAAVRAAAEALYATPERRLRAEYPVIDRAATAAKAVPGIAKEVIREPVDLLAGVVEGDPGKVSENAAPLADLVGLGAASKLGKASRAKALTANASDAAERAVRAMRHDAPADAFAEIENLSTARPSPRGYARAPVVAADDLVVADMPASGVSDLPGPPVDYDMIRAAIERDSMKSSADFPGGIRVPDAVRSNPSEFLSDDLTPGARPSNIGNLPPKPSTPVGNFMIDLGAKSVDEADIVKGPFAARVSQGPLPDIPTDRNGRLGFQSRLYEAGRQLGGKHALVVEKLAKSAGFRREAKLSLEHVKAMIENPEFTLENWDKLSSAARRSPDEFEGLLQSAAPVQSKPSAPLWRNTGANKSLDLPPAEAGLGELYEAARRIGGPQKAVADIFSDPGFRAVADNRAWTPERIRSVVAKPELLREDGDFLSALTLRNRDQIVENFVKSNGRLAEEIPARSSTTMITSRSSGFDPGIKRVRTEKFWRPEWMQIPSDDTRFPASTRGMWLRRQDYSRLEQIMGGRNSAIAKIESWIKKNVVLRVPLSHVHAGVEDSMVQLMDGGTPTSLASSIRALNGKGDSLDRLLAPEFIKRYALGDYISEDMIGAGVPASARVAAIRAAREGNLDYLSKIINSRAVREAKEAALGDAPRAPGDGLYRSTVGRAFDSYDAAAQALWMMRDYGHRYAFFRREIERSLGLKMNGTHRLNPVQLRSLGAKMAEDKGIIDAASEIADRRGFDYQNLPQWAMAFKAIGLEPFAGFKISSSAAFYDWAARNPVQLAALASVVASGRGVREREMAAQQADRIARTGGVDVQADVGRGATINLQRVIPTSIVGLAESPLPNLEDLERGRVGLVGRVYDLYHVMSQGTYPDGRPVTDPRLPESEQMLNRIVVALRMSGLTHTVAMWAVEQLVNPRADEPGSGRVGAMDPSDPYDTPDSRVKREALDSANILWRAYAATKWGPRAAPNPQGRQNAEAREGLRTRSRDQRTTSSRAE